MPSSRAKSAGSFPELSISRTASRLNSGVKVLRFRIEHLLQGFCPLFRCPSNPGYLKATLQGLYNPDRIKPDRIKQPLTSLDGALKPISWEEVEGVLVENVSKLG